MQISDGGAVRVGDRVRVRRQRWLITDVHAFDGVELVTLSGLGPANRGFEQRILTPFDRLERIEARRRFRIVKPARWRRQCRQLIAADGPADILQTARTARIELMPHQLEPALAIVRGLGSRMLLADEVGLGKTVQAGLVVSELAARNAVSRVLVLSPAGLRDQWIDEFESRFGFRLGLFNTASVARRRASLPIGINPWSVEPQIVASIDYVKRPEVLPAVRGCRWDLVVIDEAHHVTTGTDRFDAASALCEQAPYVLLLTATPHDGDSNAFTSLCALGQHDDPLLIFRRTRAEIGRHGQRRIHRLRVRLTAEERHMHACLDAFVRAVQREQFHDVPGTALALSILQKRAFSSAFALFRSVERRLSALGQSQAGFQQLALPLDDGAGELDSTDDLPAWAIPSLRDAQQECRLLEQIRDAASLALSRQSKLDALERLLRRTGEPALVFTEYRDTLMHVRDMVTPGCTIIHGGLPHSVRRAALDRFAQGGVLLSTDSAGEGLNLQDHCRLVINLELPWNPMRLEQRIGRVDRIGQKRRVHVFHLVAAATREVRILDRLRDRVAKAQADVGAPDPLQDERSAPVWQSSITVQRLKDEAQQEYERLKFARLVAGQSPDRLEHARLDVTDALVVFTKRHALRAKIGAHALVVLQSCLCDECGRVVALHLTPVLVRIPPLVRQYLPLLNACDQAIAHDHRLTAWFDRSKVLHEAFWKTRLNRELTITHSLSQYEHREIQPGLFDLRAERAYVFDLANEKSTRGSGAEYATFAGRSTKLSLRPAAPALIVMP